MVYCRFHDEAIDFGASLPTTPQKSVCCAARNVFHGLQPARFFRIWTMIPEGVAESIEPSIEHGEPVTPLHSAADFYDA